jgi:hypothetical protein
MHAETQLKKSTAEENQKEPNKKIAKTAKIITTRRMLKREKRGIGIRRG